LKTPLFWRETYVSEFGLLQDSFLTHDGFSWHPADANDLNSTKPSLTLSRIEKKCFSPLSATFGGIYKGKIFSVSESKLVQSLISYLLEQQISEMEIILPPDHTNLSSMVTLETYLSSGFRVLYDNKNHYVPLTQWIHGDLSKGNRKKLRQARELGLEFSTATEVETKEAFKIISRNRESLGTKVSVEYLKLMKLMSIFPSEYECHIIKAKAGEIAAASFVVETSEDNLYVYLWADDLNFRHVSPLVLMLDNLVSTYRDRFSFLDLGTSAIQGATIEGLSRFKDNLGAYQSHKKCIRWENPEL
jgi:hypothetical protein